jgi:hypothetical protein
MPDEYSMNKSSSAGVGTGSTRGETAKSESTLTVPLGEEAAAEQTWLLATDSG